MKLENFFAYPVYEIPSQIRRRIGINAGGHDLQNLGDLVAQNGQSATNTFDYTDSLNNIVGFDGSEKGFDIPVIDISGTDAIKGFQYEQRTRIYNFVATVVVDEINATRSQEIRYVITGYTSEADPTLTGLLPDDMVLYVNDIYGLQVSYVHLPNGQRVVDQNGYRVVNNYVLSNAIASQEMLELSLDPIAVAKNATIYKSLEVKPGETVAFPRANAFNLNKATLTPGITNEAQMLTAQLTRPESFVGAVANSYLNSISVDQTMSNEAMESFFNPTTNVLESELRTIGVVKSYKSHAFTSALKTAISNSSNSLAGVKASQNAKFRLGDFRVAVNNGFHLDAQIRDSLNAAMRNMQLGVDKTDNWTRTNGFATDASLIAYDVAMRVGQLMAKNLIGAVGVAWDNSMANFENKAQFGILPNSLESLGTSNMSPLLVQNFLREMEQVMLLATRHNRIRCEVTIISRLGQVTRVEIRPSDQSITEFYTFASFMTNRLHIGLTSDNEYANGIAQQTGKLFSTIEEGFNEYSRTQSNQKMNLALSSVVAPQTTVQQPAIITSSAGFTLGGGNQNNGGGNFTL